MEKFDIRLEEVTNSSSRFAAYDGGTLAGETTFVYTGDTMLIIDHTDVNEDYRGQNVGDILIKKVVEFAKENKKSIIPLCPFAKKEFEKHPEYRNTGK